MGSLSGAGRVLAVVFLLFSYSLFVPAATASTVIPVGDTPSVDLTGQLQWCATPRETGLNQLLEEGCSLQPASRESRTLGYRRDAIWLSLVLHNPSPVTLERLLDVSHPRMARISLYIRSGSDWLIRERGLAVPIAERGPISRIYDALPLVLPPGADTELWIRLESDLMISTQIRLWEPDAFLIDANRHTLWTSMGLGSVATLLLFGLLLLALTRDLTYGFFSLMMTGHLVTFSQLSGALQSHFWPDDLSIPSNLIPVSPLISVIGFWGLVTWFLRPGQQRGIFRIAHTLIAITASVMLYGILIDTVGAAPLIDVLVGLTGALLLLLTWRAMRSGDHAASLLFLAFCVPVLVVAVRLAIVQGWIDWSPWIASLAPWAMAAGSPIILIGLIARTRKLQSELVEVQAENAAQLHFFARMSHELRSPLDVILGQVQWLTRTYPDTAKSGGIETIRDSGRHLLRMIDDILDYAKGTAGMLTIRPEALALRSYLRGIERMGRLSAETRGNRFELILTALPPIEPTLHVLLDPDRLRQVLGNLLANACRHTERGLITLEVRLSPLHDQRVRTEFGIIDTGEGIKSDDIERVFLPFERARSRADGRRQGAGLGLAIARQLVHLMGGELSVSSTPGKGSHFGFVLDVAVIPGSETSADESLEGFDAAGYAGHTRRVLLVDDDAASRAILASLLDDLGFEVLEAGNGQSVAELPERWANIDLVLTDQYMPGGDGWLVLAVFASHHPDTPVVLLSAAAATPPPDLRQGMRFAAEFLKPIDHARLLRIIGDLLDLVWTPVERDSGSDPESATKAGAASDGRMTRTPAIAASVQPTVLEPYALLATIAAEERRMLVGLVELGQVTELRDWTMRLNERSDDYRPLVDTLLDLLEALDFPALADLLVEADRQSRAS